MKAPGLAAFPLQEPQNRPRVPDMAQKIPAQAAIRRSGKGLPT